LFINSGNRDRTTNFNIATTTQNLRTAQLKLSNLQKAQKVFSKLDDTTKQITMELQNFLDADFLDTRQKSDLKLELQKASRLIEDSLKFNGQIQQSTLTDLQTVMRDVSFKAFEAGQEIKPSLETNAVNQRDAIQQQALKNRNDILDFIDTVNNQLDSIGKNIVDNRNIFGETPQTQTQISSAQVVQQIKEATTLTFEEMVQKRETEIKAELEAVKRLRQQ